MEGIRQRRKENKEDFAGSPALRAENSSKSGAWPTWASIPLLALFVAFLQIIMIQRRNLPAMLTIEDEFNYPDRFIGERARNSLLKLESLGPKLTGSYECEVKAVRVLRDEVAEIAAAANPVHLLQQDLQRPKGSFPVRMMPHGFNSIYENIQNFAVRISPRVPSNYSVLVNCHFDTVPDSPGASDNGLNCAVMMEILRKLSGRTEPLKHNIIFLFNGAEEQFLQGAHGFVNGHHWHKEVRVVVNLDAGGAGGRETLFQATADHAWLLKLYASTVPYPTASLAGQEIFDAGLIPSDTDYRIFRDFGHIGGIDLAHCENGYIYHTRLDTMDYIAPGVYQHTGDNILALLLELANAPQLEDTEKAKEPGAKLVYFDLFNTFMIVYYQSYAIILNITVATYAIWCSIAGLERLNQGASVHGAWCRALISAAAGLVAVIIVINLVDRAGAALSWYAKPLIIFPLYAFPYVASALLTWTSGSKSRGFESGLHYFYGGQALNATVLLSLTLAGIRSSYLIMLVLLPCCLVQLFASKVKRAKPRLIVLALSSLPGLYVFLSNLLTMFMVLVPIMGRSGVETNAEIRIGLLTFITSFITGNMLIPLLACVKVPRLASQWLAIWWFVTVGLIILTPFGFPYSDDPQAPALKRFYIYHTEQVEHSPDGTVTSNTSAVFVLPTDRNAMKYIVEAVPALKEAKSAECDHPDKLLCLFPLYNGRYVDPAKTSVWLPFPSPYLQYPTGLKLLESHNVGTFGRRIKLQMKGPDHITLVISPRNNVAVKNWTLDKEMQVASHGGRSYYVVFISDGLFGNSKDFEIYLEAEEQITGPWLDINIVGHYQHLKSTYTAEFVQFLQQFPAWTQATAWLTSVHAHSF